MFSSCCCFTRIFTFLRLQGDEQPGVQSIPDLWPLWEPLPLFPGGVSSTAQVNKHTQWMFDTEYISMHIRVWKKSQIFQIWGPTEPLNSPYGNVDRSCTRQATQKYPKCNSYFFTLSTWFYGDISIYKLTCFSLFPQMCEVYWEQRHVSAHLRLSHDHPCQRCRASAGRLQYLGFIRFTESRRGLVTISLPLSTHPIY